MNKLKKRALLSILFSFVLFIGTGIYIGKFILHGNMWVTYPANTHIYSKGKLSTGNIKDRSGRTLVATDDNGQTTYIDNLSMRSALVHVIGDANSSIITGANRLFKDKLIGYNILSGVYNSSQKNGNLTLTVDGKVSQVAKEALGNYKGAVGVFNYKTGEIICMVSSPNFDPKTSPTDKDDNLSGAYLNRLTSATIVPGSIFKILTAQSVLENENNMDNWEFTCTGKDQYGSSSKDVVTCISPHGKQTFKEALANSCNCAFGRLANKVGKDKLQKTIEKSGILNSYNIDGIVTKKSSISLSENELNLAWAGVGQYKDLVNPMSMMIYMGAIANDGKVALPYLLESFDNGSNFLSSYSPSHKTTSLLDVSIAQKLQDMMKYNVKKVYKESYFPNLDIYAKTGSAEHNKSEPPHAWFAGFIKNEKHPFAFIVLVEKGNSGFVTARKVANQVLQEAIKLK